MPPPPLAWQPLQLYQRKRRSPWLTANAFSSYRARSGTGS